MIQKGKKLHSIIHLTCARCQVGKLFKNSNPFHLKTVLDMPLRCLHCNQDFVIEEGFYTAALWFSYPIVLLLFLPLFLSMFLYWHQSLAISFFIPLIILLTLQPWIMRYSRAILLNTIVHYQPEIDKSV